MRNHKTRIERLIDNTPLKKAHYKIWFLSALGVFMDGLDLFIIAVALPLIAYEFQPSKWELGLIGAASPIGAIFGASALGYLTDKIGRKKLYVGSMVLFIFFSFFCAIAWSIKSLIVFRFFLGIGIGADYPISSTYLSEFMPKNIRSRSIISAFSFQALGAIGGSAIGLVTLIYYPYTSAWRWMLGLTIIPAFFIMFMRMKLPESALWLQSKHKFEMAAAIVAEVIEKPKLKIIALVAGDKFAKFDHLQKKAYFYELFTLRFLRQTLLTSIPWFLMDICLYGVKLFSPTILTKIFNYHSKPSDTMAQSFILQAIRATTGDLLLNVFLIVGFISAILFVKKIGTIRLQCIGFIGMTVGLVILGFATHFNHSELSVFIGFALFNFMVNFGPNPTTYMLPTERFPTFIRASGHGFASSAGKVGAAIGIFFLPVFLHTEGIPVTMFILAFCSILGYFLTAILAKNMEHQGSHVQ